MMGNMPDVKPPLTCWAIVKYDPDIGEKRIVDIYTNPQDASLDATMFGPAFVEVEPFLVHQAPQYSASEPAYEESADDFDIPIHMLGEVTR